MFTSLRRIPIHKPTYREIAITCLKGRMLSLLAGIMISFLIEMWIQSRGVEGVVELTIGTKELKTRLIRILPLPILRINVFYLSMAGREILYNTKGDFKKYISNIIFMILMVSITYGIAYSILSIGGDGIHIMGYEHTTNFGKILESIHYAFSTSLMYGHPSIKPTSRLGYITNIIHQGTIIYIILILIGHRTQVKSIGTNQPIENKKPEKRGKKEID